MACGNVFVTTKVLNSDHGYEQTLTACRRSLHLLGLDMVDLYLVHWPAACQNRFVETWQVLIDLQAEGDVRSIGVSNFHTHHPGRIIDETGVAPVVNQIECHPWHAQHALIEYHRSRNIAT